MRKNSLFDWLRISTEKCDDLFDDGCVFLFVLIIIFINDESLLLRIGYKFTVVFVRSFKFCYDAPSLIQSKIEITIQFSLSKNTCFHCSKFQYLSEILEKLFYMVSVVLGSYVNRSIFTSFSRDKN